MGWAATRARPLGKNKAEGLTGHLARALQELTEAHGTCITQEQSGRRRGAWEGPRGQKGAPQEGTGRRRGLGSPPATALRTANRGQTGSPDYEQLGSACPWRGGTLSSGDRKGASNGFWGQRRSQGAQATVYFIPGQEPRTCSPCCS